MSTPLRFNGFRITRRHLQIALGMLWLLDGALQLQPFMLGTGFANQIIAPAAGGQPQFVAAAVRWGARVIAAHPVASDVPFAATQLLIGLGLLVPRTARLALAASLPWSLGVWYFGEGLSGLASGHASLLTGAPGAVVLYGVLALAAWPTRDPTHDLPARWLPLAWALVWVGGAVFQVLPGQNTGPAVAAAITGGNDGAPGWLVRLDTSTAGWTTHNGRAVVITLATTEALIGLAVLHRRTRGPAVGAGLVLALATWVVCQHFGQLYSGQATDPNTAPVIALLALALPAGRRARVAARASAAEKGTTDRAPQRARSSASVRTRKMSGARPTVDALSHKDSGDRHGAFMEPSGRNQWHRSQMGLAENGSNRAFGNLWQPTATVSERRRRTAFTADKRHTQHRIFAALPLLTRS